MGFLTKILQKETSEAASTALGGVSKVIETAANAMRRRDPETERALLEAGMKIDLAQAEINKIEAQSKSFFLSGWRPALAWICVISFAINFPVRYLASWIFTTELPAMDLKEMLTLLGYLLGFGAYRSYEKRQGIQGKH